MPADISNRLRLLIFERARSCCEYCHLPQDVALHKHEPDHIVPIQHGGGSEENNLALSCMRCNKYKGPNIGSIDPETKELVRFFNPRTDEWNSHFKLKNTLIVPLTPEARVTVKIMRLNDEDRMEERRRLIAVGMYNVPVK